MDSSKLDSDSLVPQSCWQYPNFLICDFLILLTFPIYYSCRFYICFLYLLDLIIFPVFWGFIKDSRIRQGAILNFGTDDFFHACNLRWIGKLQNLKNADQSCKIRQKFNKTSIQKNVHFENTSPAIAIKLLNSESIKIYKVEL